MTVWFTFHSCELIISLTKMAAARYNKKKYQKPTKYCRLSGSCPQGETAISLQTTWDIKSNTEQGQEIHKAYRWRGNNVCFLQGLRHSQQVPTCAAQGLWREAPIKSTKRRYNSDGLYVQAQQWRLALELGKHQQNWIELTIMTAWLFPVNQTGYSVGALCDNLFATTYEDWSGCVTESFF